MIPSNFSSFDKEIISSRIFEASVDQVFKAWSDPTMIAKWWGPHGFINTIHQFNFSSGGVWDFIMHGPDGTDYKNKIIFKEIIPNKKIIFDHVSVPKFIVQVTFDDLGSKTKVTFHMIFETGEIRNNIKKIVIDGNEQNFERLASLLNESAKHYEINPDLDLILERVVDIPPNLIWKAWTMPQHLKVWFCPRPWGVSTCEIDLVPGGKFNTVMVSPEGQEFPSQGCFLEVIENSKLVWTDSLRQGYRPSEKPFMTGIILLAPHGKGTKYRAITKHRNIEDRKKHEEMGFEKGWSIALDQLIDHMKSIKGA